MEEVIRPLLMQSDALAENREKTIAFGSLYFIGAIEKLVMECINF